MLRLQLRLQLQICLWLCLQLWLPMLRLKLLCPIAGIARSTG